MNPNYIKWKSEGGGLLVIHLASLPFLGESFTVDYGEVGSWGRGGGYWSFTFPLPVARLSEV